MNIPRLGPLKLDRQIPEWLISTPIAVPYFDRNPLTFTLDGLAASDEQDAIRAVDAFLALTSRDRRSASPYVFANYRHMVELVSDENAGCVITTEQDVWHHVTPTEIFVTRRHHGDKAVYIQITAECEWEPEHGLQIVYRHGNELARVSEQDGHLTHTAFNYPHLRRTW